MLREFLRDSTGAFLQECHGDVIEMRGLLFHETAPFEIFTSPCAGRSIGGVMVLVRRSFLCNFDFPQFQPLVDGRVLRVSLLRDGRGVVLYSIHNFCLDQQQLADLSHVLAQDIDTAMEVPNELAVLVGGGFNFLPNGESPLVLDAPIPVQPPGGRLPLGLLLRGQLERLTEIQRCMPTHFSSANSTFSRLGRFYTTIPPWQLVLLKARCSLGFCAKWAHQAHLSDHALLQFSLAWVPQMPMGARPVLRFVFSLPTLTGKHDALCIAADLDQLPVVERWLIHKDILRETARVTLAEHLLLEGASGEGGSLTLASMAGAAWFSDIRLARILLARSELARNRISIVGTGVHILGHVAFSQVIETDKRQLFSQRTAAAEEDLGLQRGLQQPKKKPNAFNALHRMSRLWSPYDKRLVLA